MSTPKKIAITEIEGFKIGNAEKADAKSGTTVILAEAGALTGVDVRGGGPASREGALLSPLMANDAVFAAVLTGGSAYGLSSAEGVMKYLEEKNIGFKTADGVVPIVCASAIYDLELDYKNRPDSQTGYQACLNAGNYQSGNYGAGTGATVGKGGGAAMMMKSGIGAAAYQLDDLKLGAVVVVNALGDIYDEDSGRKIAGMFNPQTGEMISCEETLYSLNEFLSGTTNTTIGAILTNGIFTKADLTKIAGMGHDGMARAIRPVHTMLDGDTLYAMSTCQIKSDINIAGTLAAKAVAAAIKDAVLSASEAYSIKAARDI